MLYLDWRKMISIFVQVLTELHAFAMDCKCCGFAVDLGLLVPLIFMPRSLSWQQVGLDGTRLVIKLSRTRSFWNVYLLRTSVSRNGCSTMISKVHHVA